MGLREIGQKDVGMVSAETGTRQAADTCIYNDELPVYKGVGNFLTRPAVIVF